MVMTKDLLIPGTHAEKLVSWIAGGPARDVEEIARLNIAGKWPGYMNRKTAAGYIVRALLETDTTPMGMVRTKRVRDALIRRGLLPEES